MTWEGGSQERIPCYIIPISLATFEMPACQMNTSFHAEPVAQEGELRKTAGATSGAYTIARAE